MPICAQIEAVNGIRPENQSWRSAEGPCAHLRGDSIRRGLHLVGLGKCVDGLIYARKGLQSQAAVKRIVAEEHKCHFSRAAPSRDLAAIHNTGW